MKNVLLSILFLASVCVGFSQNEDPSGSILLNPVAIAGYSSLTPTSCGTTTYNLGASTSTPTPASTSGTMSNDVWFHFVAVAEVAKIKVCNPTTFDAAIEVWNSTATGASLGASNVAGSAGKEYLCVGSLTIGSTYKVRVGRVSGTGAGTFNIIYEHFGVSVMNGYYPDPPGAATCYDFATGIQRTFVPFTIGSTRWKFIDESNTVFGPFVGSYLINLGQIAGLCEGHTYQVSVEIQANDPECGNIWWGYSVARPITTCSSVCPTITLNPGALPCGSTYCDIFNVAFNTSLIGAGFQYQFRFVTDNGSTDFCTAWQTSPIFSAGTLPYQDYFRYGKIYSVYVRAKKCNNNPSWCGPCVFNTCAMPYVSIPTNICCKWQNKNTSIIANGIVGMDAYRFRFTPVDPCAANPFSPTGPAITTGWNPYYGINPATLPVTLGTVYILQVQCKLYPNTAANCDGSTNSISGQQTDWGYPCFIGIRGASDPAAGTPLSCCASSYMLPESNYFDIEERDESIPANVEMATFAEPALVLSSVTDNSIGLNLEDAALFGDGILQIYNMNGQIVHAENLYAMHTYNFYEVHTEANMPSGIYIVSIQSAYGAVSTKIFLSND